MESNLGALSPRQSVSWETQRDLLARYLKPYWGRATLLGVLILGATGLQLVRAAGRGRFRGRRCRPAITRSPCSGSLSYTSL